MHPVSNLYEMGARAHKEQTPTSISGDILVGPILTQMIVSGASGQRHAQLVLVGLLSMDN